MIGVERGDAPKRGRRRRRGRGIFALDPRFRRLYEAALDHHGDFPRIAETLAVSGATIEKIISGLRRLGLARTVTLVSPLRCGRPVECLMLVRLHNHEPDAMESFETWCLVEPSVTCAVRVCGRFDYQLTSYHPGVREADEWRRDLERRAEVGKLEQRRVQTVRGHQLSGLPLTGELRLSPPGGRRGNRRTVPPR